MIEVELPLPLARSFPASPASLSDVRRFLRQRAAEARLSPQTTQELVLAAAEACTKAICQASSLEMTVTWKNIEGGVDVEIVEQGVFVGPESSHVMETLRSENTAFR